MAALVSTAVSILCTFSFCSRLKIVFNVFACVKLVLLNRVPQQNVCRGIISWTITKDNTLLFVNFISAESSYRTMCRRNHGDLKSLIIDSTGCFLGVASFSYLVLMSRICKSQWFVCLIEKYVKFSWFFFSKCLRKIEAVRHFVKRLGGQTCGTRYKSWQ